MEKCLPSVCSTNRSLSLWYTLKMSVRLRRNPEPIWSNREVEQFWAILEPYIRQLVSGEIPTLLDDFQFLEEEITDTVNYDRKIFIQNIHDSMWHGRYSSAVANLKALRRFSGSCGVSSFDESSDIEELKRIFIQRPLMNFRDRMIPTRNRCTPSTKY
ncbi:uncharacterized protein LOC114528131 [Dendronephthya gigantea]|uniref:uncharacterized protein LOC114528131 n=1 Tax=Dendronephthya gigantea TaxID=151771 RepID=UPI00106A0098|nr:uncharacterized protein LOC114528131 [Dendronephthya gigantea]